jgi:hypothetical protein
MDVSVEVIRGVHTLWHISPIRKDTMDIANRRSSLAVWQCQAVPGRAICRYLARFGTGFPRMVAKWQPGKMTRGHRQKAEFGEGELATDVAATS